MPAGWLQNYCDLSRYQIHSKTEMAHAMTYEYFDPHSQKENTEIHRIPKFGVNQASFDRDTAILTKKCMASGRWFGQRPNGHTFLCKF